MFLWLPAISEYSSKARTKKSQRFPNVERCIRIPLLQETLLQKTRLLYCESFFKCTVKTCHFKVTCGSLYLIYCGI